MDAILSRAGGDVGEFRRVSRFVGKYMNAEVNMYSGQHSISELLDSFSVGTSVTELPWNDAKTKKKRKKLFDACCALPNEASFGNEPCPVEYFVALYEDELKDIYDIAAGIIQKRVRGVITRNKCGVHNPHCDIGKKFLYAQFEQLNTT